VALVAWIYAGLVMFSQLLSWLLYWQNPDKSISQLHGQVRVEGHVGIRLYMYVIFWHTPWFMEFTRRCINLMFFFEATTVDEIALDNGKIIKVGHCEDAYLTSYERNTRDVVHLAKRGNL